MAGVGPWLCGEQLSRPRDEAFDGNSLEAEGAVKFGQRAWIGVLIDA